ncbi:MAG: hypothetical protein L0Y44_04845 [Phycisphaerales bacterium]|nr:hypothetical protein [Phycisphaerales bacterium]
MTRKKRQFVIRVYLVGVMMMLLSLIATPCVTGALARYRVVDLTELGFTPDMEDMGSMGINNKVSACMARS